MARGPTQPVEQQDIDYLVVKLDAVIKGLEKVIELMEKYLAPPIPLD